MSLQLPMTGRSIGTTKLPLPNRRRPKRRNNGDGEQGPASKRAKANIPPQGTICRFCEEDPAGIAINAVTPCNWREVDGNVLECSNCCEHRASNPNSEHACKMPFGDHDITAMRIYAASDPNVYPEAVCKACVGSSKRNPASNLNRRDEWCDVDPILNVGCVACRNKKTACYLGDKFMTDRPKLERATKQWYRRRCDNCENRKSVKDGRCNWTEDRSNWTAACNVCVANKELCAENGNVIWKPTNPDAPDSWKVERKKGEDHLFIVSRDNTWRACCTACDAVSEKCKIWMAQPDHACQRCTSLGLDCTEKHNRYPLFNLALVGFGGSNIFEPCAPCRAEKRNCDHQRPCDSCVERNEGQKCNQYVAPYKGDSKTKIKDEDYNVFNRGASSLGPLYYLALGYGPDGVNSVKDGSQLEHWIGPVAPVYQLPNISADKSIRLNYHSRVANNRDFLLPNGQPPHGAPGGALHGKLPSEWTTAELRQMIRSHHQGPSPAMPPRDKSVYQEFRRQLLKMYEHPVLGTEAQVDQDQQAIDDGQHPLPSLTPFLIPGAPSFPANTQPGDSQGFMPSFNPPSQPGGFAGFPSPFPLNPAPGAPPFPANTQPGDSHGFMPSLNPPSQPGGFAGFPPPFPLNPAPLRLPSQDNDQFEEFLFGQGVLDQGQLGNPVVNPAQGQAVHRGQGLPSLNSGILELIAGLPQDVAAPFEMTALTDRFNAFLGFDNPNSEPRFKLSRNRASRWHASNPLERIDMGHWQTTPDQLGQDNNRPRLFGSVSGRQAIDAPTKNVLEDINPQRDDPDFLRGLFCMEPGPDGINACGKETRDPIGCQSMTHPNGSNFLVCGDCDDASVRIIVDPTGNPISARELVEMRAYLCISCASRVNENPSAILEHLDAGAARAWGTYRTGSMPDGAHNVYDAETGTTRTIEYQSEAQPGTGCACGNKLFDGTLCRFHRLHYAEKAMQQAALMREWRLVRYGKAVCPACIRTKSARDASVSADHTDFYPPGANTAWACMVCSDWVVNQANDHFNNAKIVPGTWRNGTMSASVDITGSTAPADDHADVQMGGV
ncbi:hypothetical protein G7046_g2436 [Stylonectria norvegica]|nr:hypothetical protein G7046_g2436 [Stylonectria norvegica]